MAYRNGTYVAFDGQGTTDPTKSDMKYYGLLQSWNESKKHELNFSDSHKKTSPVRDTSSEITLKNRLLQRMSNSKNMLVILSSETNWNRGLLNYEIEKAVDHYKIPLIVAYTGYNAIWGISDELRKRWPQALAERIDNREARCIHIPFKEKAVMAAIAQFSVNSTGSDILTGPGHYYGKETYVEWGYVDR